MPLIMPIKDIQTTSELSDIAHKEQEPIFITKNGHNDLVVMSSETYEEYQIDQAIYEAEKEMENGGQAITLAEARSILEKKYYGQI